MKYYVPDEVAEILSLARVTVYGKIRNGEIKAEIRGDVKAVSEKSIKDYLFAPVVKALMKMKRYETEQEAIEKLKYELKAEIQKMYPEFVKELQKEIVKKVKLKDFEPFVTYEK